jgi:hypothetical protein
VEAITWDERTRSPGVIVHGWSTTWNRFSYCQEDAARRRRRLAVGARWRYAGNMSKQTAELLKAFEALAPDEKRIFTAEFLRRAVPFDSGPLDDEETAHAADSLFALLDAEENDTTPR